jgi:hypothetical protein
LVRLYYLVQGQRIRIMNQSRALVDKYIDDPRVDELTDLSISNQVLRYFIEQFSTLENEMKLVLDRYVDSHVMGEWLKGIYGIGPILSGGLLAHIDISRVLYVTQIWSFAGLNPKAEWKKGQIRPWNAELKSLCWKIGVSFMKFHKRPECIYGHIYKERKTYEQERNEAGRYRQIANELLPKFSKSTETYKHLLAGKLSPGHIDARARRYAVKFFLSHLFEVWFEKHYGRKPPEFYAFAILDHDRESFVAPPR